MSIESLTRDLVAIPSHEDETAAGDAIEDWLLRETDAHVERDGAGNVLAVRGDTPRLCLIGHHDVVPPEEGQLTDSGYEIHKRDGRLYGRGTADMKGALAAALHAFRDVERDGLAFASFVGEETGGRGARAAVDGGFVPDQAVVVEGSTGYSAPSVTDVAVAHKGRRGSTITATGKSAHASEVEAGVNAIYRATDAVNICRDLEPPAATVLDHDVAGSLAVTQIEGGSAWNIIPEQCSVTVDERTVPGDRADIGAVERLDGVDWTVDQDLPPMACDEPAFATEVLAAASDAQEDSPQQVVKPHATDAGWLAKAGTTCVVCGPAEPGEAHTANESVSIAVLERCAEIYRRTARRVLS
ncbi:MAG: M20 family metallopeptidase [Salinirussus sp.]